MTRGGIDAWPPLLRKLLFADLAALTVLMLVAGIVDVLPYRWEFRLGISRELVDFYTFSAFALGCFAPMAVGGARVMFEPGTARHRLTGAFIALFGSVFAGAAVFLVIRGRF